MLSKLTKAVLILSVGAISFTACRNNEDPMPEPLSSSPLYDTLGWFIQGGMGKVAGQGTKMIADPEDTTKTIQAGRLAIRTVIQRSEEVLAADPEMADYFPTLLAEVTSGNTTGFFKLRETFSDLIQELVSGQKIYKGKDMVTTHDFDKNPRFGSAAHKKADDGDFDRFIGDVIIAMTELGVPPSVQAQLGAGLESTRAQVVQE